MTKREKLETISLLINQDVDVIIDCGIRYLTTDQSKRAFWAHVDVLINTNSGGYNRACAHAAITDLLKCPLLIGYTRKQAIRQLAYGSYTK